MNSNQRVARKVVAYITRGTELLVLREPAYPHIGLQVPGGCIEPGEDPEHAVLREVEEETGLASVRIVRLLGETEFDLAPVFPVVQHRWFFHLALEAIARDTWTHLEMTPSVGQGPVLMEFSWVDLARGFPELGQGLGAFLDELAPTLAPAPVAPSDADRWDAKYRTRPPTLEAPEPFVLGALLDSPRGTLLDLAAGDGTHAIPLAELGFQVTAVDISNAGLERLRTSARQRGLGIETLRIDLDRPDDIARLAPHDAVVVSRYLPADALWKALPSLVASGGRLVLVTFNERQHLEHGFRREYCLAEREAALRLPELQLETFRRIAERGRHLDGYVFRHGNRGSRYPARLPRTVSP